MTGTNYRKTVLLVADLLIVMGAFFLAVLLKKEFEVDSSYVAYFKSYIIYVAGIYVASFIVFGLYKNMWAYAGLEEYISVMYANIVAFFACILLDQIVFTDITISTILIGAMIAFSYGRDPHRLSGRPERPTRGSSSQKVQDQRLVIGPVWPENC